MVSLAYLVSILGALIAISRAEEVTNGQAEQVDSKWFGGYGRFGWGAGSFYSGLGLGMNPWLSGWAGGLYGGCYGYGLFGGLYNNILFAKATDQHSVSRRAVTLDADQLLSRRGPEPTVSCVNEQGTTSEFLKSDCVKAANQLAEKKLSSASYGGCSLSLVSPKDRVAPKQLPAQALEKAVDGILKACSTGQTAKQGEGASAADSHDNQVAMLLSKAIDGHH